VVVRSLGSPIRARAVRSSAGTRARRAAPRRATAAWGAGLVAICTKGGEGAITGRAG
jgi:hypothetical protein